MAIIPVPPLTDIPPFPALSDRAAGTYNGKAFDFATHMADKFNDEVTALAQNVMQNATEAQVNAVSAATAAATAEAAAQLVATASGAVPWVSGTSYAKYALVISPANGQVYRRRIAGSGTVDPVNDLTNWALPIGTGSFIPQAAATTSIDLSRGNYFTKTLNGNETLTFDNCPQDGYSFTIEVEMTSGVLTLPTSVRTPNGTAYILSAGKSHLLFFVTKNRGARWRMTAAPNYDI